MKDVYFHQDLFCFEEEFSRAKELVTEILLITKFLLLAGILKLKSNFSKIVFFDVCPAFALFR